MNPDSLATINDLRGRIIKVRALRATGTAITPDLEPTRAEMHTALTALRAGRATAPAPSAQASKYASPDFDLNSMFDKPAKPAKPAG